MGGDRNKRRDETVVRSTSSCVLCFVFCFAGRHGRDRQASKLFGTYPPCVYRLDARRGQGKGRSIYRTAVQVINGPTKDLSRSSLAYPAVGSTVLGRSEHRNPVQPANYCGSQQVALVFPRLVMRWIRCRCSSSPFAWASCRHSWSCWQASPTRARRSLRPQSLPSGDGMEVVVVVVVEVCPVLAAGTGTMQVGGVACPGSF